MIDKYRKESHSKALQYNCCIRCTLNKKYFDLGHRKNNSLNSTMLNAISNYFPLYKFYFVSQPSNNVKIIGLNDDHNMWHLEMQ